jgi:2-polyprenyl-3-methyl-5-hydroxy-6-metoxy-1,4-benzoquinol methylase
MKEMTSYYSQIRPEVAAFVPKNIKTILDIGCGQGAFVELVKKQTGAITWGVEVVPEIAEKAKDKVDHILVGKIEEEINAIPNGYFDCITMNDVLEHLLEPTEVLKMIRPKLSENGVIVASIPNVRCFYNLYDLILKKDWEYRDAGILDSTHIRFFTKKSMRRMFEHAGYEVINQKGINEIKSWKFRFINFMLFNFFTDIKFLQYVCLAKSNK